MNRADRVPPLLIVAGVLMLVALAAYLINHAEARGRHYRPSSDVLILRKLDRIERLLEGKP